MDVVKLKARTRTGSGKKYTIKSRAQGWIPAVYYGHGQETKSIEVEALSFAALVRGRKTNHLIDLGLSENGESIAIIKDSQRHVLKTDYYYHIDFQHVRMDEKIVTKCPLVVVGTPVGVLEENGVLGHPVQSVNIECLPADIPENITIDVTNLHVGQSIHVKDVSVPKITIKDSPDEVLAVVTHAQREAEAAPAAAAEGEAAPAAGAAAGEAKEKKAEKPEKK